MQTFLWCNGTVMPEEEARVSPFDHGLTVGDGVFETLIAYDGSPFAVTRHCRRLERSGAILGVRVPEQRIVSRAFQEVLGANGFVSQGYDVRLRVTATAGVGPLGSEKGDALPLWLVTATRAPVFPATAAVIRSPWTRNESGALAGAKTTSYGENVVALAHAKAHGGSEAVFANTRGDLCEGTGSNIFLVRGGILRTPPLDSGALAGVTRAVTLELARELDLEVSEQPLPFAALDDADEIFLTSTTREIQPVSSVDGVPVNPGPVAVELRSAFQRLKSRTLDP